MKNTTPFILFALISIHSSGQLAVSNSGNYSNVSYLVQNVLLSGGVTVSNITYNCPTGAYGFFNGVNANLGLDSGIVLTSGSITNAIGPNIQSDITTINGTVYSDPDLTAIEPSATNDVCILEFDFIPNFDTVVFEYVFGSDEYPEFVNLGYNDAFGFFLSGANPSGPPYNGKNIAIIPSSTTPVAIDNLNNGTVCPTSGPCMNCAYYVDNCSGTTVEYDGFSIVMKAIAGTLIPGQTYHIKMAIADASDDEYDSGVFLKACSFGGEQWICGPVAIHESEKEKQFIIYPNPSSGKIQVISNQYSVISMEVYNVMGEKVYRSLITDYRLPITIDLSAQPDGVYFIAVTSEHGTTTQKLIIQK